MGIMTVLHTAKCCSSTTLFVTVLHTAFRARRARASPGVPLRRGVGRHPGCHGRHHAMAFPRSSPWTAPCRRVLRSSISVVVRQCRGPLRRLGGHVRVPRVCALSPTTLVFVVRARTNDRQALTSTGRPNHSDRLHVAPPILPLPILIHIWTC